ncbi:hypothetical protein ACFQRC_12360 [Enterovirga sp. GCM10030262]|uniref:hypothetical protein n=1 Tax=Enterovirga sp. GCM10030262 TaxID=3273391 RepID=UPI003611D734
MAVPIPQERLEKLASTREDFMRRWFAIAISVGFAATVVQMPWVDEGRAPNYQEWEQLFRLGAALTATVLSWEGYLLSISTKRLFEFPRYFIDIALVFLYLFLLLTSKFPYFWLALHAITFGIYMVWDFLTAYWHREWYKATEDTPLWRLYWQGLIGAPNSDRGLVITAVWAIYFLWLWLISRNDFCFDTFILAMFVLLGLAGYRYNKGRYRDSLRYSYLAPLTGGLALTAIVVLVQRVGNCI